jgi:hypothetical protein
MTPCSLVDEFGAEDGGRMFLWNFGTLLKEYTEVISVSYFSDFPDLGISLVEEFRDGVERI